MPNSIKNIGEKLGRYLSDLPFLIIVIFAYFILSILTYFLLASNKIDSNQSAGFITYIIATGGDPAPYLPLYSSSNLTYGWIMVFHIISWLFVPVIIALAADALYRLHEERKNKATRKFDKILKEFIMESHPNLTNEKINELTKITKNRIQEEIDEKN